MSFMHRPLKWPPIFPLQKGLIAWYPFDDRSGAILRDRSIIGNHGTLYGPTWVARRRGSALSFDGITNYVSVGHHASLNLTSAMTAVFRFNPVVTLPDAKYFVSKGTLWFTRSTYAEPNTFIQFALNISGWKVLTGTINVKTAGVWVHAAVVYDGANQYLYVNGVLDNSRAQTGNISTSTDALIIGAIPWAVTQGNINAIIDEVRIFNRALNAAEIKRLYESELMIVRH